MTCMIQNKENTTWLKCVLTNMQTTAYSNTQNKTHRKTKIWQNIKPTLSSFIYEHNMRKYFYIQKYFVKYKKKTLKIWLTKRQFSSVEKHLATTAFTNNNNKIMWYIMKKSCLFCTDMRGHLHQAQVISADQREMDEFSEQDVQDAFGFLDMMDSCMSNQVCVWIK